MTSSYKEGDIFLHNRPIIAEIEQFSIKLLSALVFATFSSIYLDMNPARYARDSRFAYGSFYRIRLDVVD